VTHNAARLIEHGPRDRDAIALTFDADLSRLLPALSGADRARPHREILALLRASRVPATLFLTGIWVEAHREDAESLGSEPLFEIGNHSYSHRAFTGPCFGLPVLSDRAAKREEVVRGAAVIADATGRHPSYFRFPGGCYSEEDVTLVRSLGEQPIQWDVLSGDAFDPDPASVTKRILAAVRPGSIVVMHLSEPRQSVAAEVLVRVVPQLRARGLELVTLSELLTRTQPGLQNAQLAAD
jgi:peptidoglycan/xylan/chitin deacetylase (PgdA/CDA1 family)